MTQLILPRHAALTLLLAALALGLATLASAQTTAPAAKPAAAPPAVGDVAADFTLDRLDGGAVALSGLAEKGPVVLVVLRGYPGYQCPICTRQFAEYLRRADDFAAAGAGVVFVYPGPAAGLKQHAGELVAGKQFPAGFRLLVDPDYAFTNQYGLRWDAPGETAYPSTFVLAKGTRKVAFAKISHTHAGRASAAEVLKVLGAM